MKKVFNQFSKIFIMLWLLFIGVGNAFSGEVIITPENSGWTNVQEAQSGTIDCVNTSLTKGVADGQLRIYKGETLTISSDSVITKIEFTCTANGTTKYGPGCFAAQDGYTFETSGKKGTWTGNATSVEFTASSNQVRATQIVVTINGSAIDTIPIDTTSQDTITPIIPDTTVNENIMVPGENASEATVNGKIAVKVGTSKNVGTMTITVPSDAITLVFYAAAWKGAGNPELTITLEDKISPNSIELTADDGISNNSPFTLSGNENEFKFEFELLNLTEETIFTLTSSKRFVVWNASYEVKQITTDIETPQTKSNAYKIMKNGEIQIHRDNKIYNIYGNLVH